MNLTALTELLHEKYDPSSWGDCNEINATAAYILQEKLKIKVELVSGYVALDNPLVSNIDEPFDGVYDPAHMWILINGEILDFAAQQFEEHLNDFKGTPYFKGTHESYNKMEIHSIENEWVDHKIVDSIKNLNDYV